MFLEKLLHFLQAFIKKLTSQATSRNRSAESLLSFFLCYDTAIMQPWLQFRNTTSDDEAKIVKLCIKS